MVQDAKEPQDSAFDALDSSERLVPSPVDRQWLLLVSRLVAISDATRSRADRLAERLALQHELSAALADATSPRDAAAALRDRLLPHLGGCGIDLSRARGDGTLEPIAPVDVDLGPAAATAFRLGEPLVISDLHEAATFPTLADRMRAAGVAACVALPLGARGQRLGALAIAWATPRHVDDEERAFLVSIANVVAQTLDRTARTDTAHAVDEKQALVDLLARAVPQIIWITEGESVVFLNERWTDYTGLPIDDTLAKGWSGLRESVHPDDVSAVAQSWNAARTSGQTWQLEYRMRRHDGVYRWHLGRAVPQVDLGGTLRRWVGTATDIDDLRRAEAEKAEEDAFRERLFGIAGHDLRNPLNAIVMAGALLDGREELSPGSRKLVARIRRSADRMTRLARSTRSAAARRHHRCAVAGARASPTSRPG